MRIYQVLVIGSFVALAACDSPDTTSENAPASAESLPANDLGNTYPSQTGETAAVSPGAEGGRGSAETGATDGGPDLPDGAVDPIRPPPTE